jgi:hypothetical protein
MSDNELDNLFKEAAEGFKAPKDPSAWDAMSKRLDSAGVGTAGFWNWKTISGASLAGVTGVALLIYFTTTNVKPEDAIAVTSNSSNQAKEVIGGKPAGSTPSESVIKSNASESDKKTLNNSPEEKNKNAAAEGSISLESKRVIEKNNPDQTKPIKASTNPPESQKAQDLDQLKVSKNLKEPVKANVINKESASKKGIANSVAPKDESRSVKNVLAQVASAEKSSDQVKTQKELISDKAVSKDENTKVATEEKQTSEEQKDQTELKQPITVGSENAAVMKKQEGQKLVRSDKAIENSDARVASPASNKPEVILVSPDTAKTKELKDSATKEETLASEKKEEKNKEEKVKSTGLSLKVAIAPDYSSVGSVTPSGLGYGYGMLFEYRFSSHWSVATGGIWEKKIYSAKAVEYNGHKADRVDGDCRMWDIPVNVYYSFAPARRVSFYTGVGFSSYIMNKENYVLHYDGGAYGSYDYPLEVKGENNEWFKMLNVSIGMQLRLNNVLSLQVEPTLKAPLAGVGEGEVSLVSLGAFFNVRFDIPIKK